MNKNGLTLLEIIITVALLGVVALLFMSIFSNAHMFIVDAGKDTKTLIDEQEDIELKITSEAAGIEDDVDMNDLFPSLYTIPNVDVVEGVRIEEGTFTAFLPGVTNYIIPVTGLILVPTHIEMAVVGDQANPEATIVPVDASNQEVTWSSSDTSVVTVDVNGFLTATGVGTNVTVTASADEGNVTSSLTVTVLGVALSSDSTLSVLQYYYPSEPDNFITVVGFVPGIPPSDKNYVQSNIGPEVPVVKATENDANASITNYKQATNLNGKHTRVAEVEITAEDGTKSYYRIEFKTGGN